jgi:dimethylglycine dehydrogenase
LTAGWIVNGRPEWDIWSIDSRRLGDYATIPYTTERATELYRREYAIAFPAEEWEGGRPAYVTPLYEKLKAKGARFGARGGWERAVWFHRDGVEENPEPSFRRPAWHKAIAEEVRAVRERVGIMDMGGFTKLIVSGAGAEAFLDHLVCGRLPKQGRLTLTWALDDHAGIVSEFTITRLSADKFYLCSAASAHEHDLEWIHSHLPTDGSVRIDNVSHQYGTLIITGPKSREVLAAVTDAKLDNENFPWLSAREIEVGYARFWALRVGYVGELGWELHAPLSALPDIYDRLWKAGESHDIRDFGVYAMDSMRIEKGYRGWKGDITREYTPLMASLDRFVAFNKSDFRGRDALTREREKGPKERLVLVALDDAGEYDPPSCSTVWHEGKRVGIVATSAYGHHTKTSLSLAYVQPQLAKEGTKLTIEICGEMRPAHIVPEVFYDPNNDRLKA